jgi:hypothetical protein
MVVILSWLGNLPLSNTLFQKRLSLIRPMWVYAARNYRYVGGAYATATEEAIMKEIKTNGPVVMSFEPTHEFMYYQSGIYQQKNTAVNNNL